MGCSNSSSKDADDDDDGGSAPLQTNPVATSPQDTADQLADDVGNASDLVSDAARKGKQAKNKINQAYKDMTDAFSGQGDAGKVLVSEEIVPGSEKQIGTPVLGTETVLLQEVVVDLLPGDEYAESLTQEEVVEKESTASWSRRKQKQHEVRFCSDSRLFLFL